MSISIIEEKMVNTFLRIYGKHGNAKWAIDKMNYLIFEKHKKEFWDLSESEQWQVRNVLDALKKVHY